MDGDILQTINKDSSIQRLAYKEISGIKWYYVEYNGVEGRAHSIAFIEKEVVQNNVMLGIKKDVNLRNKPTTNGSKIIQTIDKGTDVGILSSKEVDGATWYNVLYGDKEGWINAIAFK